MILERFNLKSLFLINSLIYIVINCATSRSDVNLVLRDRMSYLL